MRRRGSRRERRTPRTARGPGAGRHELGSLAVRTLGASGSPVVLLHGPAASGRYWGAGYDDLAREHRLVVPDLLGFGRSPRPTPRCAPDTHADALASCLRELGVSGEPAVLVGHSLGVLVALRFARRYPGQVAGVLGFGPPIAPTLEILRDRLAATGVGGLAARRRRRDSRLDLVVDRSAWRAPVRVPVHLVVGSEDPVPDRGLLRELVSEHPNLTTAVWAHAGHHVPFEHAAACRVEIEEFLSRAPLPSPAGR
jgi:pimeloyl-ACP methyl ester carboxylesterase